MTAAGTGGLHCIVCMKAVPKPEEVQIDPTTNRLDRTQARNEINPADMHAIEMALALRDRYGGQVSLLSMGPPFFEPYLRVGLMMGADTAYLLSDRAFGGADTLATSLTLAKGIGQIGKTAGGYDLVLCGEESSDGATGEVPPSLAEWLDVPQVTYATALDLVAGDNGRTRRLQARREIEGGHEVLRLPLPAVVSVPVGTGEPRFLDSARRGSAEVAQVTTWDAEALGIDPAEVGTPGSATLVTDVVPAGHTTRQRLVVGGTPEDEARRLFAAIRELVAVERKENGATMMSEVVADAPVTCAGCITPIEQTVRGTVAVGGFTFHPACAPACSYCGRPLVHSGNDVDESARILAAVVESRPGDGYRVQPTRFCCQDCHEVGLHDDPPALA
ncbi:MAG: hypothetical protein CL878_10945 [Dehalococcoidia bacterium]|nr:hypothetical protein [Dehalococcoidia bacterium]